MGKKISTQKGKQRVSYSKDSKARKDVPMRGESKKVAKCYKSDDVSQFIKDSRSTNDISWYTHYPELVNDVGSIFMSRPNGQDYPASHNTLNTSSPEDINLKQGGFLRVKTQPSWGGFTSSVPVANNAINVAASKLYYYVVHGNSRNTSYDKGDLMKAFMIFDSLAMVIAEAKRVYSFIKAQDLNNRWVRHIVEGLGWDYDDLTKNVVQFRSYINLVIEKFNQISLPDLFDIFKAHVDMFSHVYRDRTGAKCQYSAAISSGVWLFSDEYSRMDYVFKGTLNGDDFDWSLQNRLRTVNDFYIVANYILSTIYDSTDIGEIRADILMAFRDTPMITATMLTEEVDLPLSYDEEWNLKLHNVEIVASDHTQMFSLTTTPNATTLYTHACYVDDPLASGNVVYYNILGSVTKHSGTPWADNSHIMDLPDHIKTDRDAVLLMQQLKHAKRINSSGTIMPDGTTNVNYEQFVCGAFAVEAIEYIFDLNASYAYPRDAQCFRIHNANQKGLGSATTPLSSLATDLAALLKLSEFGITLPLKMYINDSANSTFKYFPMLYEVENLTVYSDDVLYNILHTCIESLFYNSKFYNA